MERPLGLPALVLPSTEPTTDDPYWGMHEMKGGLEMDGAFARYDYGAEPFYLPTLWMARYYLQAGRSTAGLTARPPVHKQRDQIRA